jgi:hypothetical protein
VRTPRDPEGKAYRFHQIRLAAWTAQIPIAIATPLKNSVAYLVFLSLAALVESAGTDVYNDWKERRRR